MANVKPTVQERVGGGAAGGLWPNLSIRCFSQRTSDFLYERNRTRRRNAHKKNTFAKFLMHFQPFMGLTGFTRGSMHPLPPPADENTCTFVFSPSLENVLRGPCCHELGKHATLAFRWDSEMDGIVSRKWVDAEKVVIQLWRLLRCC